MPDDELAPYRVNAREGCFEVVDGSGRVLMVCRDAPSAENYAVLLNDAFRQGHKAGYRDAKRR